jgi:hypothetical protein
LIDHPLLAENDPADAFADRVQALAQGFDVLGQSGAAGVFEGDGGGSSHGGWSPSFEFLNNGKP